MALAHCPYNISTGPPIVVVSSSPESTTTTNSIWFPLTPLRRRRRRRETRRRSPSVSSSSSSRSLVRLSQKEVIWNWNRGMESSRHLITTENHLRHVESLATMPSGAGNIPHLNAIILGESLASEENDLIFPSDDFSRKAHVPSPQKYLEMYKRSIEDPAGFWSDIASSDNFYWKQKWGQQVYFENFDVRKGDIKIEWFKGGITNICYNCLDKNVEAGLGDQIALYWEGNEPCVDASLTYPASTKSLPACKLFERYWS